jgi:GT2 family glycosyltransferase
MASVKAADVSVVVVSYNTREQLRRCIDSIDAACEVIVVDNASEDGSLEMLRQDPRVRLIENGENLGFGPANNRGIAVASRPLVLLLNSDAWSMPGAISSLASVFEDEQVIAAGGMLLNPDGSIQQSCANELSLWAVFCEQTWLEKIFRRSALFSPYWMTTRLLGRGKEPHEVAQVMGACLMFRPKEMFDERFFLYCEDTELCHRLRRHGKILYVPKASFTHELGTSSKAFRWKSVAMYNCGKELFFRIHRDACAASLCFVWDRMGAVLRCILGGFTLMGSLGTNHRARDFARQFWRVLFAPTGYAKLRAKK